MSDFTTMQCPNCGGQLTFSTNALSMRCQHCGTEHMVKQDSSGIVLESYARCPMCNRNDRAEKVSAILRSQTHNVHSTTIQTKTTMVKFGDNYYPVEQQVEVPTHSSQTSDLAAMLAPPQSPGGQYLQVKANQSHVALIFGILLGLMGSCILMASLPAIFQGEWSVFGLIFLCGAIPAGISALLLFVALPKETASNEQYRLSAEAKQKAIALAHKKEVERWERAMERWRQLYYCGRDDCVFVPGVGGHAQAHHMIEFLYRE